MQKDLWFFLHCRARLPQRKARFFWEGLLADYGWLAAGLIRRNFLAAPATGFHSLPIHLKESAIGFRREMSLFLLPRAIGPREKIRESKTGSFFHCGSEAWQVRWNRNLSPAPGSLFLIKANLPRCWPTCCGNRAQPSSRSKPGKVFSGKANTSLLSIRRSASITTYCFRNCPRIRPSGSFIYGAIQEHAKSNRTRNYSRNCKLVAITACFTSARLWLPAG